MTDALLQALVEWERTLPDRNAMARCAAWWAARTAEKNLLREIAIMKQQERLEG